MKNNKKNLNCDFAFFSEFQAEEFDVDSVLKDMAVRSEGFSGREISKLAIGLQVRCRLLLGVLEIVTVLFT